MARQLLIQAGFITKKEYDQQELEMLKQIRASIQCELMRELQGE